MGRGYIEIIWLVFIICNFARGHEPQVEANPVEAYIVNVEDVPLWMPYPPGTIHLKISDILRVIPEDVPPSAVILYFKENQTESLLKNSTFEIFTLNRHGHRHHHVTDVSDSNTGGWRTTNLMSKFKYWRMHYLEDLQKEDIFLNIAQSGEYSRNLGFLISPLSRPVLLVTAAQQNKSLIRAKRDLRDSITTPCRGIPNEGCCLKSIIINLDERPEDFGWWLSPRNFEARVCQGHCVGSSFIKSLLNLESSARSCCVPAEYDRFSIDVINGPRSFNRWELGNQIRARSCKCK